MCWGNKKDIEETWGACAKWAIKFRADEGQVNRQTDTKQGQDTKQEISSPPFVGFESAETQIDNLGWKECGCSK